MAKLATIAALFTLMATASVAHADDIESVADEAGVDATDLKYAVATVSAVLGVEISPKEYLIGIGELTPPQTAYVAVQFNSRVACIENRESRGENVWNGHTPPRPGQDKAGGVMQYFEQTFRRGAAEMGHPEWSRWNPDQARAVAAHDLAMGRRTQWTVSGC